MIFWFELLLYVVVSVVLGVLIFSVAALSFKLRKETIEKTKLTVDNKALREKLAELRDRDDTKQIEQNEGFLKFISQSRDWAFQYIEKVQVAIKNFQDVFHPFAVQYYEKKKTRITKEEFEAIAVAYRKLVEELPNEGKK